MIEVIIFDLDGLLVDSQPLQYKATSRAFRKKGYKLTNDDWYGFVHRGLGYKELIDLHNLQISMDEVRELKKNFYNDLIEKELELKPGANELINLLNGKFKLAVASSSRMESIELSISKFNLKSKFDHLISDHGLEKKKPHPEVFLHAAKTMGVGPESCLVLEDSLAGLSAARGARMKCIICPDRFIDLDMKLYADAHKIVGTLNEVTLEMIRELEK